MSLAVSGKQFPGSIQMGVLANTGENIEDLTAVGLGILHAVRRQDRQSIMRGKIDKLLINTLLSTQKMSLDFNENIFATKSIDQKPSACAPRPEERNQSLRELRQLIPLNRAFSF